MKMGAKPDSNLDDRHREVLRQLILTHVATGEPVSSRALARSGRFDLSSATLRNAMADLEELGFLAHWHTSGGRVPSESGYRYFIDHLMRSREISDRDRRTIEGELEGTSDLDEMLRVVSRLLTRLTDQVGVVFMPGLLKLAIRSVDLISVGRQRVMCVIVGLNGLVLHRVVDVSFDGNRDELRRISNRITQEYTGFTLADVRTNLEGLLEHEKTRYDFEVRRMAALGIEVIEDAAPAADALWIEGTASIANKPEFSDGESMRKALGALEEKEKLVEILNAFLDEADRKAVLGSESSYTGDHNFGLVAARYGYDHVPMGLLGVIGPVRMPYAKVTPLIEYLGESLSRKMKERSVEVLV